MSYFNIYAPASPTGWAPILTKDGSTRRFSKRGGRAYIHRCVARDGSGTFQLVPEGEAPLNFSETVFSESDYFVPGSAAEEYKAALEGLILSGGQSNLVDGVHLISRHEAFRAFPPASTGS